MTKKIILQVAGKRKQKNSSSWHTSGARLVHLRWPATVATRTRKKSARWGSMSMAYFRQLFYAISAVSGRRPTFLYYLTRSDLLLHRLAHPFRDNVREICHWFSSSPDSDRISSSSERLVSSHSRDVRAQLTHIALIKYSKHAVLFLLHSRLAIWRTEKVCWTSRTQVNQLHSLLLFFGSFVRARLRPWYDKLPSYQYVNFLAVKARSSSFRDTLMLLSMLQLILILQIACAPLHITRNESFPFCDGWGVKVV